MSAQRSLPMLAAFKNELLSVSRLRLYEQCALAFFFKYVQKGTKAPRGAAGMFGTVLHAALELVYLWIVEEQYTGAFPSAQLVEGYKKVWQESDMVGVDLYQEGLTILRTYARTHERVDHFTILAVEKEFNITVEGFRLNGYIDRIEKDGDDGIVIVDYKSNRSLYTKQELDADLQMSIYGLAARQLYPWATRVRFVFEMLRHGIDQPTTRAAQEIDDAAGYVAALGRRTEADAEHKATINGLCGYCDHRLRCEAYAQSLEGKPDIVKTIDMTDLEAVAKEREAVSARARALWSRKETLETVLRTKLSEEGSCVAGGMEYKLQALETSYDVSILDTLATYSGLSQEDLQARVLRVDPKAVQTIVDLVSARYPGRGMLLKTTVEALAKQVPAAKPRLDGRALKKRK